MSGAWTFAGESADLGRGGGGSVTLVDQSTFSLSAHSGDVTPGGALGIFAEDTRLISRWQLHVGGHPPEPLSAAVGPASAATFALRVTLPDGGHLTVMRRRQVTDGGVDETLELRNHTGRRVETEVSLAVDADLADLFAVKEGRVTSGRTTADADHHALTFDRQGGPGGQDGPGGQGGPDGQGGPGGRGGPGGQGARPGGRVGVDRVRVEADGGAEVDAADRQIRWAITLEPGGSWSARLSVRPASAGRPAGDAGGAASRASSGFASAPSLRSDLVPLDVAYRQSLDDLAALRLYGRDPDGLPVVAAGAPWFMALFGRDSLLTAFMALLVDHDLAVGVLEALAALQGSRTVPETEEQPGRIPHEVRYGGASVYYGTVDATPLFVVLLGECLRWGVAWERLEPLLPHADRALEWIERDGDRDGDGYVEYERMTPHGLPNQGWKDSSDAIVFADGRLAEPPIALCEVQGYVFAAYRARAALARRARDAARARDLAAKADQLRARFDRDFWLGDRGWYALALDADKRPVDALASNMAHCLWTGLARPDRAAEVAPRLVSPELFSGWGVRTLATSMTAYDPVSYQRGSVWPHDTAIAVAGLARYGHVHEASTLGRGLLDAAGAQGGRLPELFAGYARDDVSSPVAYPTSCSPQAWASAAPLLVLRSLLGLEPDVPAGRVRVRRTDLDDVRELVLDGVPLAGGRLTVRTDGTGEVSGTRSRVEVETTNA